MIWLHSTEGRMQCLVISDNRWLYLQSSENKNNYDMLPRNKTYLPTYENKIINCSEHGRSNLLYCLPEQQNQYGFS